MVEKVAEVNGRTYWSDRCGLMVVDGSDIVCLPYQLLLLVVCSIVKWLRDIRAFISGLMLGLEVGQVPDQIRV